MEDTANIQSTDTDNTFLTFGQHYSIRAKSEWTRRTAGLEQCELVGVAILAAIVTVLLVTSGANWIWITSITFSTIGGFTLCYVLILYPELCATAQQKFCRWLEPHFKLCVMSKDQPKDNYENPKHRHQLSENNCRMPPWTTLRLSRQLNSALEEFFETFVDNYINSWYKANISSSDDSFLLEVRHQIRHAAAVITTKLKEIDVVGMFIDDLLPVVIAHVERVARLAQPQNSVDQSTSTLEARVLSAYDDFHLALCTEDGQREYLRVLADVIVAHCVDATQIGGRAVDADLRFTVGQPTASTNVRLWWPSHSCRHFLRELLLHTTLLPTLDFVSDPDMLNRLLLNVLSGPTEACSEANDEQKEQVEFLENLTHINLQQMPDSLLSLKLNDLVREPRLIQLFDMYLRDIQGPPHLLDCFLQARDVHKRIQTYRMECAKKDVNESEDQVQLQREQQMVLSEIKSDAWQLFSAFVHESAPNQINFSAAVRYEFAAAISGTNDPALLEKTTEDVYKELYQKLHFDYVIPFCQSESYLGYLCSAPPDVEELIRPRNSEHLDSRSDATSSSRPLTPTSTFSLTQFRTKLFSVIGGGTNTKGIPLDVVTKNDATFLGPSEKLPSEITDDLETGEIALVDLSRDLNKWTITISSIECRRELVSSKTYFVYAIEVHRNDLANVGELYGAQRSIGRLSVQQKSRSMSRNSPPLVRRYNNSTGISESHEVAILLSLPNETTVKDPVNGEVHMDFNIQEEDEEEDDQEILPLTWTIYRKYDEFFQLEEKIREFHGNTLRTTNLPDRRNFLSTRNRSLLEAHRPLLERFLQTLIQQPILKRSELLYDFLTLTEDEWSADMALAVSIGSNFMPDLRNPLRAMRRMPTKLARERGQNLKPFILNVLANVLVPRSAVYCASKYALSHEETDGSVAISSRASSASNVDISRKNGSTMSLQLSGGAQSLSENVSGRPSSASNWRSTNSLTEEPRTIATASSASPSPIPPDITSIDNTNMINSTSIANVCDSCRQRQSPGSNTVLSGNEKLTQSSQSLNSFAECEMCRATLRTFSIRSNFPSLNYYFKCTGLSGALIFVMLRILRVSRWLEAIVVTFLRLFKPVFEPLARRIIRRLCFERVLCEKNFLFVMNALKEVIFEKTSSSNDISASSYGTSAEERRLRADLTLHRLEEAVFSRISAAVPLLAKFTWVNATDITMRAALRSIFSVFQLPNLNRQLAFVLIDRVTRRFLGETDDSDSKPTAWMIP